MALHPPIAALLCLGPFSLAERRARLLAQVMRQQSVEGSLQYRLGELLDEAVLFLDLLGCAELQQKLVDDARVDAQGVTLVSGSVARIRSHTAIWRGPTSAIACELRERSRQY